MNIGMLGDESFSFPLLCLGRVSLILFYSILLSIKIHCTADQFNLYSLFVTFTSPHLSFGLFANRVLFGRGRHILI